MVSESPTGSRYGFAGRPWRAIVPEVQADGCIASRIRAEACVLDIRFEKAFETDVTERVVEGFRAAGIARPTVLHHGV